MSYITAKTATIAVSLCLFVAGCGTTAFSERESNPIIQDTTTTWLKPFWNNKDNVDVFATTASRRMVVVREGSKTVIQPDGTVIETRGVESCAEPPPDVGEVFSAAVAGGLQAAASLSKGDDTRLGATLAGQFARQVATQIAPLLYRTQGLQLNRDAQYALCIDFEWIHRH
jgi:hypothetical protein